MHFNHYYRSTITLCRKACSITINIFNRSTITLCRKIQHLFYCTVVCKKKGISVLLKDHLHTLKQDLQENLCITIWGKTDIPLLSFYGSIIVHNDDRLNFLKAHHQTFYTCKYRDKCVSGAPSQHVEGCKYTKRQR